MLRQIETGKAILSVALLRHLTEAPSVSSAALLDEAAPPDTVWRAGHRPRLNDALLRREDPNRTVLVTMSERT